MRAERRTILLVENNPAAVVMVERAFRQGQLDFALKVVLDGREALLYLGGEPPYTDRESYPLPVMVISNIQMPHVSGFELLTWMRRQDHLKDTPVVMLSSSALESDSDQAYALGAFSYLIKPIGTESLINVVQSLKLS
ncbi:response regulator [Gloeobacter morelensis]|uniref:Response regulator n=1 Tax=Gloeobacter morelensis MG652769 TaxID=2781736 RepID=A0ABY3PPT4_9CYAN|nr:response regulator [Gloeobacter morelensis]UFP95549.1 response regulator [Gloeobacter morelensis MG652769]